MSVYEKISGFADEISQDFDQQLKTVTDLGMKYICIRSAEHKGIADYTPEEVRTVLLPKLQAAGVGVSSLGTAIGKVEVDDEEGFAKQLEQLETLCENAKLLNCSFIRMFSFLIPKDADADSYTDVVLDKLRQFIRIAEKHDIVLLHENEKGIYGDTGARCKLLHDQIAYIHIKDALPGCLLNVPAGTGLGKIPELLRRAFCEEGYHGFLTLEPHLAMFDFFAPGAKGGESQKLQFENNPIVEKMKSEMAEPGRPKDGAEAYATQYHALVEILKPILN